MRTSNPLWHLLSPVRARLFAAVAVGAIQGAALVGALCALVQTVLAMEPGSARPVEASAWLLVTLALLVLRHACRTWVVRQTHVASHDLEHGLRGRLLAHLHRVPSGLLEERGSASWKRVIQDDVRGLHGAAADAGAVLGPLLTAPLLATVALGYRSPALAALSWLPVVVAVLAQRRGSLRRARLGDDFPAADAELQTGILELVDSSRLLPITRQSGSVPARFLSRLAAVTAAMDAWNATSRRIAILQQTVVRPIPTLLLLFVGAQLLGVTDSATLLTAALVGTVAVESVTRALWLQLVFADAGRAAQRIHEVLALPVQPRARRFRAPRDGSLRLRSASYTFPGRSAAAVDRLDLDVPEGTVCALVGVSGSGKSTVLRLITRALDVDSGEVWVGGTPVREISPDVLSGHVATVLQETHLLANTIAANLRVARPDASMTDIADACSAAAVDGVVARLEGGYDHVLAPGGRGLSGGERQRLGVARALLSDSPIVLLDEPTSQADPENEALIQDGLGRLCVGKTVVIVAHRLGAVVSADQIVVLERGRAVERGTHEQLLAASGQYARMWEVHKRAEQWELGQVRP